MSCVLETVSACSPKTTRVWIYNWEDDRFFGCFFDTSDDKYTASQCHQVAATKMISGRQARLDAFIGVVVGSADRLRTLCAQVPYPILVQSIDRNEGVKSPLVYNPLKLLNAPHELPRGSVALLYLTGYADAVKHEEKQQRLSHVRRFLLHNEIRLCVHLSAFESFELNACLLYSARFPRATTKLPYGWVTVCEYTSLDTKLVEYDIVQDTGCECCLAGDVSATCNIAPQFSCVSLHIEVAVPNTVGILPHYSVHPVVCVSCIEGTIDPNNDKFQVKQRVIYTTLQCLCHHPSKDCEQFYDCHLTTSDDSKQQVVTVVRCDNERQMLNECISKSLSAATIITGYKVTQFALPYLYRRSLVLRRYQTASNVKDGLLTAAELRFLDSDFGNSHFRHQMPVALWKNAAMSIRLPQQLVVDVHSYVQQFSEAAFKGLASKALDDVCEYENIFCGDENDALLAKQINETWKTRNSRVKEEFSRSLDPHLVLPRSERSASLPLMLLTKKKYFRFILSLSQLTGNSVESVLETHISSIISNFHSLYSLVAAETITPYRFVYNGTSAVGTDFKFHVAYILNQRNSKGYKDDGCDREFSFDCRQYESSDDDYETDRSRQDMKPKTNTLKGGHVIQPCPGIYGGAIDSIDIESLYPSAEIALNMSPGTIFRLTIEEFNFLGGDSDSFRSRYNIFPADNVGYNIVTLKGPKGPFVIVQHHLLQLRRKIRQEMETHSVIANPIELGRLDAIQKVLKLMANGSYGTVASKMLLPTTNRSIGETTTFLARKILLQVASEITNTLRIPVLYGDTDSLMLFSSMAQKSQYHDRCHRFDTDDLANCAASDCSGKIDSLVSNPTPPTGAMLAERATTIVGHFFPETIDAETGLPIVKFAFERRYFLYAVCRKKINVSLLSPSLKIHVTGLQSHAPKMAKSAVLRVLQSVLRYRVSLAIQGHDSESAKALISLESPQGSKLCLSSATTMSATNDVDAFKQLHESLNLQSLPFTMPSSADLVWVAKRYLLEYRTHFIHSFENARSIHRVRSCLVKSPDYIRRMCLVLGTPIMTDTVEHVRIWSDFSVERLDRIINVRIRNEYKSCYFIDINSLFFTHDRGSLLRDTLVWCPTTIKSNMSSLAEPQSSTAITEAATMRLRKVAEIATRMWTDDIILPSLCLTTLPQLGSGTVDIYDLTDSTRKLDCKMLLRLKFSSISPASGPLSLFVEKLQAIARALVPEAQQIVVSDWGEDTVVAEIIDGAKNVFVNMMARGRKVSYTSALNVDLASFQMPQLILQNPTETLQRSRANQGWEIGAHASQLVEFLCFLSILYWRPTEVTSVRDRLARQQACLSGDSLTASQFGKSFLNKLQQNLRHILRSTRFITETQIDNYVIIRSSCGCALFYGQKMLRIAACIHDLMSSPVDTSLTLQAKIKNVSL